MNLDPAYFLSNPDKLRENDFSYVDSTYAEICELRAGKAIVYTYEHEVPILDIYDKTGRISFRWAFLNGKWTKEMPGCMLFGNDVYCISVEKFLDLYKTASDH